MWDVFISHAAEDKAEIATPLAEALTRAGLRVWYDDFTLKLGDGLNRSIDHGLAETRFGIVILSPSFFAKEWPRRELDGLSVREVSSGKIILPVWHKVSRADVERFSPILADKLAVSSDRGLDVVVNEILQVLRDEPAIDKPPPKPKPWRIVAALAAFIGIAIAAVFGYHQLSAPSDVQGKWLIEATDKTPKTYITLELLGGKLYGNTTMLFPNTAEFVISGLFGKRRAEIFDAQVAGNRVSFTTKRQYTRTLGEPSTLTDLVHHYEGHVEARTIRFTLQVDERYYEKVTAERVTVKAPTADLVATLQGHRNRVNKIALLPDGRLASASSDQTVKIWNLSTLEAEASFEHGSEVKTVIPLAGEQIVSAESDGWLRTWDLRSRKQNLAFQKPVHGAFLAAVPIGDGRIAGSWSNGQIMLWNLVTGRIARTLGVDERQVLMMTSIGDGRLATGDQDGKISIWNLASGKRETTVRTGIRDQSDLSGLQPLKDGRLAFSAGTKVTIWNPASGQNETAVPARNRHWAQLLSVLEDGRLAILDSNSDIVLWDPITRKADVALSVEDVEWTVTALMQLPDGRLAVGTSDGPINLWKLR